ncbi:MAG: DUF1295 domain-containing protein [Pseudomonadota bacterium]
MQREQQAWIVAAVAILVSLVAAVGLAAAGSSHGVDWAGWPVFMVCALFAYLVQWVMFAHAWAVRSERNFDLTGSVTFVSMMLLAGVLSGSSDVRSWALIGLISLWALRLGPFLHKRIKNAGEDKRFRSIRHSFPTFLMTWTLQGNWVFITAGCALAAVTSSQSVPLGGYFACGLAIWLLGFVIEVVADRQKTEFRSHPENADRFIRTGLWAWSRHPNYFGEIVLWLGVAVISYPVLQGWQLATLVSPVFVVILLTAISGVRMLEARATKTWGDDPEYQDYKRSTPTLLLWPPQKSVQS